MDIYIYVVGFPGGDSGKLSTCQCRRLKRCEFDSWVRKIPGGGHDNPLQYSCLENPVNREAVGHSLWSHKDSDRTEVT